MIITKYFKELKKIEDETQVLADNNQYTAWVDAYFTSCKKLDKKFDAATVNLAKLIIDKRANW